MHFTLFNLVLVLFALVVKNPRFVDFVRATSFMVFVGWLMVVVVYGYGAVIRFYRGARISGVVLGQGLTLQSIFVIDFICHILPLLLLGLPRTVNAVLLATLVIILWYVLVRERIHELYLLPAKDLIYRDGIVLVGGAIILVLGNLV